MVLGDMSYCGCRFGRGYDLGYWFVTISTFGENHCSNQNRIMQVPPHAALQEPPPT
jgi:hypothetical protein